MSRRPLARRYWDAYEASLAPPPGSAARNLSRLQERIEAGEEIDLPARRAAAPRRAAAGMLWWGKAAGTSVGLGVSAIVSLKLVLMGWAAITIDEPEAPAPVERRDRTEPVKERAPVPTREAPRTDDPAPVETSPEPAPDAPPVPRSTTRRPASPSTADALRAELALMDRARAALESGDASTLSQLCSEHARRFPQGALAEEREAWQAVAACTLGRSDAQTRAAAFLREHPGSAQAQRVRAACVPTRTIE